MDRIKRQRENVTALPAVAVFCSGFGSNLQAIIAAVRRRRLPAKLALVVSDCVDAYALVRAARAGIPVLYADPALFSCRGEYEKFLVKHLRAHAVTHVVLAGFMRLLSPYFVRQYKNRIVNIHPSLLPAFPGKDGIGAALQYGVKITGVTVHLVDEKVDHGPIIAQQAIVVRDDDTRESLAERIHRIEHRLYPQALRPWLENRISIENGRKARIADDGRSGNAD